MVFFDTDEVPARETKFGELTKNDIEAFLVQQTIEALVMGGVRAQDIGVISPYRAQLKAIEARIKERHPDVEVHTVDRYQGRQKKFIIFSLVRSNASQNVSANIQPDSLINGSKQTSGIRWATCSETGEGPTWPLLERSKSW